MKEGSEVRSTSASPFRPLDGRMDSCASTSSTSAAKSDSRSRSRVARRFRLGGYAVLSVRGYDRRPARYRSSATAIAFAALRPRRVAPARNDGVLNGGGGGAAAPLPPAAP